MFIGFRVEFFFVRLSGFVVVIFSFDCIIF